MTNPFTKPLLLVALVLLLPLVLLAFAGESFYPFIERVKNNPPSPSTTFVAVVGILATDVFLPVPSGPISTLAGSQLGIAVGTIASTIGMTIGSLVAFALARRWGRPLAERLTTAQELRDCETLANTFGITVLLVTRPLPVLAEAAVLLLGMAQMNWRIFLPVLIATNFLISITYATLGYFSSEQQWLVLAVCLSVAVPVFLTLLVRRYLNRGH